MKAAMLASMPKIAVNIRLDSRLVTAINEVAKANRLTKTDVVEHALYECLGIPVSRPEEILRVYLSKRKAEKPGSLSGPSDKRAAGGSPKPAR